MDSFTILVKAKVKLLLQRNQIYNSLNHAFSIVVKIGSLGREECKNVLVIKMVYGLPKFGKFLFLSI